MTLRARPILAACIIMVGVLVVTLSIIILLEERAAQRERHQRAEAALNSLLKLYAEALDYPPNIRADLASARVAMATWERNDHPASRAHADMKAALDKYEEAFLFAVTSPAGMKERIIQANGILHTAEEEYLQGR